MVTNKPATGDGFQAMFEMSLLENPGLSEGTLEPDKAKHDAAPSLTPTQQKAFDEVTKLAMPGSVIVLQCDAGYGRTTILRALHSQLGGRMFGAVDFVLAQLDNHPLKFEEAVFRLLWAGVRSSDVVLVDEFDMVMETLSMLYSQRRFSINLVLRAIANDVIASDKRLILVDSNKLPWSFKAWSHTVEVSGMTLNDREFLFRQLLPPAGGELVDRGRVFRQAHNLDCRQIARACAALRRDGEVSTESLVEWINRFRHDSNVDIDDVERVQFDELVGMDSIIEELRIHLLIPLKANRLCEDWNLRPKRGILLHGPPGTGKTSLGRALAHELQARFFLIRGDSHDRDAFMRHVRWVFRMARDNAPSVVFIDDSDVLLKDADIGSSRELYRFLLDHLDGVGTRKWDNVCVVMTAMDLTALPRPLLRSGRIELWLDVRPPDEDARLELLERSGQELWRRFGECDLSSIVSETEGLTGSDLKRLVDDTKNMVADHLMHESSEPDPRVLMQRALAALRKTRARYDHGPTGRRSGFRVRQD